MQENNKSKHLALVEGDGTQNKVKTESDANWFGKSKEPQEEFVQQENGEKLADRNSPSSSDRQTSEGKPTLTGREK